jgi:phosphoribosylformimino-5-aminoimidazole carboxamide ribotide isomerase
MFQIIPAIDIIEGKCVRLFQGDYSQKTEYGDDPVLVAQRWHSEGATFLHLVDLDGAKAGKPINLDTVGKIAAAIPIPVEIGGGIRTIADIDAALSKGVSRVILGTVAQKNPGFVKQAVALFGDKIVVGIDCRDGKVAVQGWTQQSEITAGELGTILVDHGIKTFIFTDISKDGTLSGPNIQATVDFAHQVKAEVIASGGVSGLNDIKALKDTWVVNLTGVIVGKALYDGKIELAEALKI